MQTFFLFCGLAAIGFVPLISVYLILSGLPAIREVELVNFLFGRIGGFAKAAPLWLVALIRPALNLQAAIIVLAVMVSCPPSSPCLKPPCDSAGSFVKSDFHMACSVVKYDDE